MKRNEKKKTDEISTTEKYIHNYTDNKVIPV